MLDQRRPGHPRDWIAAAPEFPFGRGINLEIKVRDAIALHRGCEGARATIFLPLETKTYRCRAELVSVMQFIVQDPDGYLLRFSERQ